MKLKSIILAVIVLGGLLPLEVARAQWNLAALSTFLLPNSSILTIVTGFLMWLLMIIGLVAIISFIISGIMYLTAAGDETQATRAKRALTYSIIGIIVALSGVIAVRAIYTGLQGMQL